MEQTINVEHLPAGLYLVTTKNYKKNFLTQQYKRSKPSIGEVTGKWEHLPYLSLKENVLLGVDKSRRAKLLTYIKLTEIDPRIFMKQGKELTQFDKIKLQFVHLLLKDVSVIYLRDCFSSLTVNQMQWILNFCRQLVQKYSLRILLFSKNEQLIQSTYMDETF